MLDQGNELNRYIYTINYTENLKELCELEIKSLFGYIPQNKFFITNRFIHPSRSIFIKNCIVTSHVASSLEALYQAIQNDTLFNNDYKIRFIKFDGNNVHYKERLEAIRKIGFAIEGDFALQNPKNEFGVTKIDELWFFGQFIKHEPTYLERKQKPFNYSYALDHQIARSLINIAVGNDNKLKVVDPCCGIGTVLIEGRELGVNIKGFDINPQVVDKCNRNLKYFGYNNDVEIKDIVDLNEFYDVAIVDLPYGKFSTTTLEEQNLIIEHARRIARKAIFISMDDISACLTSYGFTTTDRCIIKKREQFSRSVFVCY
jgi:tRNA (guanine10-N2)-dimethyltransferase